MKIAKPPNMFFYNLSTVLEVEVGSGTRFYFVLRWKLHDSLHFPCSSLFGYGLKDALSKNQDLDLHFPLFAISNYS